MIKIHNTRHNARHNSNLIVELKEFTCTDMHRLQVHNCTLHLHIVTGVNKMHFPGLYWAGKLPVKDSGFSGVQI